MIEVVPQGSRRLAVRVAIVAGAVAFLVAGELTGVSTRATAALFVLVTLAAVSRTRLIGWSRLIAALILIILLVPIRRYTLPGSLPFQLEPYRILVALLILGGFASLLVDSRVRFRRTGFEGPLALIVGSAFASIVANPERVAQFSSEVNKALMFFLSFVLVLYLISTMIRRLDDVDFLTKTLVIGGAIVALFAIIEARTDYNVFNHLSRVLPVLRFTAQDLTGPDMLRVGTARLRVFASAQHPIALSAALVMLMPLALYLARRYRQRRWNLAAFVLFAGCASTVSRTGITMLLVVALVFLWLRPRETRRCWPALIPALIAIHIVLPGTLGALKQSFFPAGGIVAQQNSLPGQSGSGRLADLGPSLQEWKRQPLVGEGFGTRVAVSPSADPTIALLPQASILDDQWLGALLDVGALGTFGWLWFFVRAVRRFGAEARRDDSARGWLLVSLAAGVAAYAVGMMTYDAFAFIQVTFLLFIFVGLGAVLLAERPTPHAVQESGGTG